MKKYLSMKMKKNFYFILFHVFAIIFNFCIPNVLSDDYFYDDPSIPYSNSLSECQLDTLVAISFFACEHDGQASFIEKNYMNIEALLKRMFSEKSLEQWNQNALERSSSYVKDLFKERPKQKLLEGKLLFRAEKIVEQYFFYENKKKLEYIEKKIFSFICSFEDVDDDFIKNCKKAAHEFCKQIFIYNNKKILVDALSNLLSSNLMSKIFATALSFKNNPSEFKSLMADCFLETCIEEYFFGGKWVDCCENNVLKNDYFQTFYTDFFKEEFSDHKFFDYVLPLFYDIGPRVPHRTDSLYK